MQFTHTLAQQHWISFIIILLTGCTGGGKDHILPQTGPTMKEVYDQHFSGGPPLTSSSPDAEPTTQPGHRAAAPLPPPNPLRPVNPGDQDLSGYTRETYNEINNLFPRLTNPTLVMYIYPHLSGAEGHPVPGYSTAFPLYKGIHYALPGEAKRVR